MDNIVSHVLPRTDLESIGMGGLDTQGGALFCSLTYPSVCPGLSITRNIAAGVIYAGFTGPAHDCNDSTQQVFRDNVAHSVSGGFNGDGAVIFPDPSKPDHKKCFEVSHFKAYKVTDAAAITNFPAKEVNMHSIVSIDNAIGVAAMIGVNGIAEYLPHHSLVRDCKIYAESPIPDCPIEGTQCKRIAKSGLVVSIHSVTHSQLGMEIHCTKEMHCPLSKQIENSSWEGKSYFRDIDFYNFKKKTKEGEKQIFIKLNPKASDMIQMQQFENLRFHDSEFGAMTWFFEPPMSWANLADCGDFPCTGPKNTVMSFKNIQWLGTVPADARTDF